MPTHEAHQSHLEVTTTPSLHPESLTNPLAKWLAQKIAHVERFENDHGITKVFQLLPSYSNHATPGAYAAELIGFFAAADALKLRPREVSLLHVEALDQELKSQLLYAPERRKQFAKDFSSQEHLLIEKLSSYYPSLSLSNTDTMHMHIGARAAKILHDLTKKPYLELSKQTAKDRGKYQVASGYVRIPPEPKE